MHLLILTTFLSFLCVGSSYLTNPLIKWLKKPSSVQQRIAKDISTLREEQSHLSVVRDFVAYSKLQRQINKHEMQLEKLSETRSNETLFINIGITFGFKIILGLALICFVLYHRYTPVYVFPTEFSFYPFGMFVSYPINEDGSVSVHFWLIVSNIIARKLIS